MEPKTFAPLDDAQLQSYRRQQPQDIFQRIVENRKEHVEYLPNSTLRVWVNAETYGFAAHWHMDYEIILPLEGTYRVIVGVQTYDLLPGDIFLIPGGELHELIAPPEGIRLIYLFAPDIITQINGFSYLTPYIVQPVLINERTCGSIYEKERSLLMEVCENYFGHDCLREMTAYARLIEFFLCYGHYRISSDLHFEDTHNGAHKDNPIIAKFNTILDYIEGHYMEDISLEDVSTMAGFSKYYFCRLFKQSSGYTFGEYLSLRRIKAAEDLLLQPELSVTSVAMRVGFSSLSSFNRAFRRVKSCTPSEYRSLYEKNQRGG